MLCCAVLCCAVLCHDVLCRAVLCHDVLCCAVLVLPLSPPLPSSLSLSLSTSPVLAFIHTLLHDGLLLLFCACICVALRGTGHWLGPAKPCEGGGRCSAGVCCRAQRKALSALETGSTQAHWTKAGCSAHSCLHASKTESKHTSQRENRQGNRQGKERGWCCKSNGTCHKEEQDAVQTTTRRVVSIRACVLVSFETSQ